MEPYAGADYNLIWGRIQRETWCMGPYAGFDYNLTLCPLQSRLRHIYHGQPYARVDFIPQSGTLDFATDLIADSLVQLLIPTTKADECFP